MLRTCWNGAVGLCLTSFKCINRDFHAREVFFPFCDAFHLTSINHTIEPDEFNLYGYINLFIKYYILYISHAIEENRNLIFIRDGK